VQPKPQEKGKTMTEDAPKKAPPLADARVQVNGEYITIGAQWACAKRGVTSIKLDRPVDSFILVNRRPRPKTKPAEAQPS
jgi:hypothetical protein